MEGNGNQQQAQPAGAEEQSPAQTDQLGTDAACCSLALRLPLADSGSSSLSGCSSASM